MTSSPEPKRTDAMEHTGASIENLNLTPEGLADAPARQEEPDSLVHVGNS
jgi:hypothetical protein